MTDRERNDLRGLVMTVVWASFLWDSKSGAVPEKPSRLKELTFSPQGSVLEDVSQYQDGRIQRFTYYYDEAGRLREIKWRNSDGTQGGLEVKYDQHGQPIQTGTNVIYSSENGRKVKTEVFDAPTPGVSRAFAIEEGASRASWAIGNAALASTFYDGMGRPAEVVFYDEEHVQISKLLRTYDERGRVTSEEHQTISPRAFAGQQGTQGEGMPQGVAELFARIFSKESPMLITFQYDDQDRVIEQTQHMGLFGYEKTVSFYNDHGDLTKQRSYSTHQGDIPVDEEGNIVSPPPVPERLQSETDFSYEYDERGNWTRKKISTLHYPESRWETVEERSITYYSSPR
jgi:YD repeat-containing protein